eukprot:GHVR01076576.1.p1 GENE.GHVR01076576.1~~GHVR01076576.1.p1  ORF type:complete len:302 (-),score=81.02 GHVR01076576.1:508-1413(-)
MKIRYNIVSMLLMAYIGHCMKISHTSSRDKSFNSRQYRISVDPEGKTVTNDVNKPKAKPEQDFSNPNNVKPYEEAWQKATATMEADDSNLTALHGAISAGTAMQDAIDMYFTQTGQEPPAAMREKIASSFVEAVQKYNAFVGAYGEAFHAMTSPPAADNKQEEAETGAPSPDDSPAAEVKESESSMAISEEEKAAPTEKDSETPEEIKESETEPENKESQKQSQTEPEAEESTSKNKGDSGESEDQKETEKDSAEQQKGAENVEKDSENVEKDSENVEKDSENVEKDGQKDESTVQGDGGE